jgi:hypothetical protein
MKKKTWTGENTEAVHDPANHTGRKKQIRIRIRIRIRRERQKKNMEERLKWAIGLAKLGREKAQTTWQTEIYGKN